MTALKKASYFVPVALLLPVLILATLVAVVERIFGADGSAASWVARPFLRSVERDGRVTRSLSRGILQ